jgi:hypothetical protein
MLYISSAEVQDELLAGTRCKEDHVFGDLYESFGDTVERPVPFTWTGSLIVAAYIIHALYSFKDKVLLFLPFDVGNMPQNLYHVIRLRRHKEVVDDIRCLPSKSAHVAV